MKKYWLIIGLVTLAFASASSANELDCDNVYTTIEINQCAAIELESAQKEMQQYLAKSLEHKNNDPELVKAIKHAQDEWAKYLEAHCNSVYTQWRDGTIRGVMSISCHTKLTKQRTHELWLNFLTYMDSTPPVLPEPKL